MVLGGFVLAVMAAVTGEFASVDVGAISRDSVLALLYLLVIGSLVAFTVYGWMLRVAPLPLVATYAYVNPVVAVILGAIILGETIDPRTVVAGAIIVISVAVIVTARGRMPAPRRHEADAANPSGIEPLAPVPAATAAPPRGTNVSANVARTDSSRSLQSVTDPPIEASMTTRPTDELALLADRAASVGGWLADAPGQAGRSQPWAGHGSQRKRPVLAVAEGVVGLDERVELARPLVDDRRLRVAQVALDRELVRVAVGAVDLDGVERGLDGVLGGVPLGEARLARVPQALVLEPAGAPDEEPTHLGAGCHLGDELLDQLVLADLLPERVPLVGVADARVQAGLGEARPPRPRP